MTFTLYLKVYITSPDEIGVGILIILTKLDTS